MVLKRVILSSTSSRGCWMVALMARPFSSMTSTIVHYFRRCVTKTTCVCPKMVPSLATQSLQILLNGLKMVRLIRGTLLLRQKSLTPLSPGKPYVTVGPNGGVSGQYNHLLCLLFLPSPRTRWTFSFNNDWQKRVFHPLNKPMPSPCYAG